MPPEVGAAAALDAVEAGEYEVLVDDFARQVRAALSAPLSELCPALATPVRCSTGTAWADVCSRPRWQPFTGGRGVLLSWGDVFTLAGGGAYGEQRARPDVAWSA